MRSPNSWPSDLVRPRVDKMIAHRAAQVFRPICLFFMVYFPNFNTFSLFSILSNVQVNCKKLANEGKIGGKFFARCYFFKSDISIENITRNSIKPAISNSLDYLPPHNGLSEIHTQIPHTEMKRTQLKSAKSLILFMSGEGIEPSTYGLRVE